MYNSKYYQMEKFFVLNGDRELNILVVNDFTHRFLVVQVVMENGVGKQIDLQPDDRIVALNGVMVPELTLKKMRNLLKTCQKKTEPIQMTVLRKFPNKNVDSSGGDRYMKLMSPRLSSSSGRYAPNTPLPQNRSNRSSSGSTDDQVSFGTNLSSNNSSSCFKNSSVNFSKNNFFNLTDIEIEEERPMFSQSNSNSSSNRSLPGLENNLTSTPVRNPKNQKKYELRLEDIAICSREFLSNKENYRPKNFDIYYDADKQTNVKHQKISSVPAKLEYLSVPENQRSTRSRPMSIRTKRRRAFQLLNSVNETNLLSKSTKL